MVINNDMDKTSASQPAYKKPSRRMTWHPDQLRKKCSDPIFKISFKIEAEN